MVKEFNINLFRKGVIGLNNNLEIVGEVFHKNIDFLASDKDVAIKEKGVDQMADEIAKTLDSFNNNYLDFENLYREVVETIKEEDENKNEYADFLNHVEDTFPKYISELNQSIVSMTSLEVKTAKFNEVINDLSVIIVKIIEVFKKFLKVSFDYLDKKEE
ncbi:hypothetical protein [Methanobrevibacter sp. DSM 116169]|uniref:hypothetical protein n=1 Tax=Methanobrevibacter sp. DSM 116169 TaxID=3242727 RepID=UPI0038FC1871